MFTKFLTVGCFLLAFTFFRAYSQDEIKYYHKIWDVVKSNNSDTVILRKIDSIKKTRRPNDSEVEVLYNRDVDFGYTQQKIAIRFNGFPYMLNLFVKKDQVIFASADFNTMILGTDIRYKQARKIKIDTLLCQQYLKLHNSYYVDSRVINDLVEEISSGDPFASYCGDGAPETPKGKHLDTLVMKKDVKALEVYLKSINCEQQNYSLFGFARLKKSRVTIPALDKKLITHIINRKSAFIECAGDIILIDDPSKTR